MVYLTMLPVIQNIQRRMMALLINELERIWKETAVAQFEVFIPAFLWDRRGKL
jgi:hypothetical protein